MRFRCSIESTINLPLANLPGQGHQIATTTTGNRNFLYLCKKHRTKSIKELSAKLVLSNGKKLGVPTVRRRLLNTGYKIYTTQ